MTRLIRQRVSRRFILKFSTLLFRLSRISQPPVPTVSVIIEKESKVLVVDLKFKKGFALPGGIVEKGEIFKEAIIRETKEETGYNIEVVSVFGEYPFSVDFPTINVCYIGRIVSGELASSEEGTPMWISQDELVGKLGYKDNAAAFDDWVARIG